MGWSRVWRYLVVCDHMVVAALASCWGVFSSFSIVFILILYMDGYPELVLCHVHPVHDSKLLLSIIITPVDDLQIIVVHMFLGFPHQYM